MAGTFKSKELVHKIERIKQLTDAGLNTPRMYHIFIEEPETVLDYLFAWARSIHQEEPDQIFNIRTYRTIGEFEEKNTPHITDVKIENLIQEILKLRKKSYTCMVDAETPDNGRWAGNIMIHKNTGIFEIDYCNKPVRAMVRQADQHITGSIHHITGTPIPLAMVVGQVTRARMYDYILEWTIFEGDAGVKREPIVYWEFRNYQ
jgi:hypothetical protein